MGRTRDHAAAPGGLALAVGVSLLAMILTGCGSAGVPQATPGPSAFATSTETAGTTRAESPASTSTTEASAPTVGFGPVDEAVVADYMAQGLDRAEATFLALTTVEVERIDDRTARILQTYPTGNTGELTISVNPATGDPEAVPTIEFTEDDEGFRFRLEYFLPSSAIPADVLETLPAALLPRAVAIAGPMAVAPQDSSGYQVAVDATVKKFSQDRVSDFVKHLDGQDRDWSRAKLYSSLKAGLSPQDALKLRSEFDDVDAQLDELRRCVENPTNPVVIDRYAEDPDLKQQLLERIEDTRSEIKGNTLVLFLGLIAKVGGGLAQGVSWLGYITGSGTAVAKDRLQNANRELLEQLRREIPGCDAQWRLEMTASDAGGLVIAWSGTVGKAPLPPGREGPVELRGVVHVDATWTFDTCSIPTDLSGNYETRTGAFVVTVTGDLAIDGTASLDTGIFPPKEKLDLSMTAIEESFDETAPSDGCLEAVFVVGILASMAGHPDATWGPLSIHAEDGATVRSKILPELLDDEFMSQLGAIERVATLHKLETP